MKISLEKMELDTVELNSVLTFINKLSENCNPILYSIRKEYWNRLNLPESGFAKWWNKILTDTLEETGVFGDVTLTNDKDVLFYDINLIERNIKIGFVGKSDEQETAVNLLNEFKRKIMLAAQSLNAENSVWVSKEYDQQILQAIENQSSVCIPSEEETDLSLVLEDAKTRNFLYKIKDCSSTSIAKIFPQSDIPQIAPIVDIFEKRKVITKEFVVQCGKTGQPILKVSSRNALEETPQGANKCFICGNSLANETIDEIISCSEIGKKFIENGFWLQIRILHSLKQAGVDLNKVRIWQGDNSFIYLFSIINGQSYLFVLTDKKTTVDDMYKINLYISSYNIENVLLISTEPIPLLIKKHIEKSSGSEASFNFIETLEAIDKMIDLFIIDRSSAYISNQLSNFVDFTPVKLNELIIKSVANREEDEDSNESMQILSEENVEKEPENKTEENIADKPKQLKPETEHKKETSENTAKSETKQKKSKLPASLEIPTKKESLKDDFIIEEELLPEDLSIDKLSVDELSELSDLSNLSLDDPLN